MVQYIILKRNTLWFKNIGQGPICIILLIVLIIIINNNNNSSRSSSSSSSCSSSNSSSSTNSISSSSSKCLVLFCNFEWDVVKWNRISKPM